MAYDATFIGMYVVHKVMFFYLLPQKLLFMSVLCYVVLISRMVMVLCPNIGTARAACSVREVTAVSLHAVTRSTAAATMLMDASQPFRGRHCVSSSQGNNKTNIKVEQQRLAYPICRLAHHSLL